MNETLLHGMQYKLYYEAIILSWTSFWYCYANCWNSALAPLSRVTSLLSCRSLNFIFQPDDETSANAFKCGRRLVKRPAQGDAHLQFESPVNIEILEFTPTNLASHSGRVQGSLRRYYVYTIWDNFHLKRLCFFYIEYFF